MNKILERLDSTIQRKIAESPNNSHTAKLFKKGTEKCAETLYHMCVLLRSKNISIMEVLSELASREGVSGIEEKRKRKLK